MLIAAVWGFAEASLFFIVADVPISFIAVRWGWHRAVLAAIAAALAAVPGGALVYVWASGDPTGAADAMTALPGVTQTLMAQAAGDLRQYGEWAMVTGSFSGIPYKLYALAAAIQDRPLGYFLLATPLARLPRFLAVALVTSIVSGALSRWLDMFWRMILLSLGWIIFYAFYWGFIPADLSTLRALGG